MATGTSQAGQDSGNEATSTEVAAVQTDVDAIIVGTITNAAGADVATDVVAVKAVADAIVEDITSAVDEPPTTNSLQDILHKDGSYTYDNTTDSLEAIRDNIDTLNAADQVDLDAIIVGTITNATGADVATDVVGIKSEIDDGTYGLSALKTLIDGYDTTTQTDLDAIIAGVITNAAGADVATDVVAVKAELDNATYGLSAIQSDISTGSLEIEADAGTTSTNIIDAASLTQATNDWWKGATIVSLNGQNQGQARPIVSFDAATDSVDVYPAFLNTPDAGDDFLVISSWRPHGLDQQPSVAVSTNANIAAVDIFDLNTTGLTYLINNVRIKSADPGANTVTITLYELINDSSVAVDTFDITTANYGTYFSLYDMFSINQLAGDDIQITVSCDADGNHAITGQYQYAQAYTA